MHLLSNILDRSKLSVLGLSVGLTFFAASLTPSMVPRTPVMQGALGGATFAIGYFLVFSLNCLWRFLQIPELGGTWKLFARSAAALLGLSSFLAALVANLGYQNKLRSLMAMPELQDGQVVTVIGVAFAVFVVLLLIGRILEKLAAVLRQFFARWVPLRLAVVVSAVLVAVVSWNTGNGVLLRRALVAADQGLQEVDAFINPELPPPNSHFRSGGPDSLISWESLGARGREFVAGGWSTDQIAEFHGGAEAMTPIRLYAGLNSAEDVTARAEVVLQEMLRTGAFEREVLVVVSPTGTGWIDGEATDPLEVMHRGNTAIVGMQYSYLSSPLSLLFEEDRAPDSAQALAEVVHDYWSRLPKDRRPRLYLHGLSLGSYASEQALSPLRLIRDPIAGALWSGPTFKNALWKSLTRNRNPGSPYWSPRIDDSTVVRFTTQRNTLGEAGDQWSRTRLIYLQYPSDAITFFEVEAAYRPPEWMEEARAPDVLEGFTWFPIITMLQLAVDMATATNVPKGFGHLFAAEHYIDAWQALTDPKEWEETDAKRLKSAFLEP